MGQRFISTDEGVKYKMSLIRAGIFLHLFRACLAFLLLNDVYVCCLCLQERMLSQTGVNARSRDLFGLRCLPGKIMLLQTDFVVMYKDIIEIVTTMDGQVI